MNFFEISLLISFIYSYSSFLKDRIFNFGPLSISLFHHFISLCLYVIYIIICKDIKLYKIICIDIYKISIGMNKKMV